MKELPIEIHILDDYLDFKKMLEKNLSNLHGNKIEEYIYLKKKLDILNDAISALDHINFHEVCAYGNYLTKNDTLYIKHSHSFTPSNTGKRIWEKVLDRALDETLNQIQKVKTKMSSPFIFTFDKSTLTTIYDTDKYFINKELTLRDDFVKIMQSYVPHEITPIHIQCNSIQHMSYFIGKLFDLNGSHRKWKAIAETNFIKSHKDTHPSEDDLMQGFKKMNNKIDALQKHNVKLMDKDDFAYKAMNTIEAQIKV